MKKILFVKMMAAAFLIAVAGIMSGGITGSSTVNAAPYKLGPKKCKECHAAEVKVWEGTKHFESYKKIHKSKKAKKIVKAVGDKKMKKSATCALCHYTGTQKKAGGKVKVSSGPSCESCHGAASDWIDIHNNYGKGVKRADETPEHKAERLKKSMEAGMVRPDRLFDVASNCMACHGLARSELKAETAAAMLDNGHPINPDFELVAYSQGSVRHRFYPPDVTTNQELTDAEKSQMFVVGHAAALVSATQAISKSSHAKYKAAQEKRIANAKAVLEAVKGQVSEAGALLASPTAEAGRALAEAVKGKDLTGAVGGMLPNKYK